MFDALTGKFQGIFRRLRGEGAISERALAEALKEIRLALLEADVNFKVVKDFVESVRVLASREEVLRSLTPGQQVVKVVQEELVRVLGGGEETRFRWASAPPTVVMMVGLQGSGKTTTSGKLARWLVGQGKYPLLVPCDVYRPAAVEQLFKVGAAAGVPVYDALGEKAPVAIAAGAMREARSSGRDIVLVDSAGRLHIDDLMMTELELLKTEIAPNEILLVADAMTGQDAVRSAMEFNRRLGLTGVILSKLDGDARGGAALSIRAVTGTPLRFVGTGEKLEALEPFDPERMASRILGMGDVLALIEKASEAFSAQEAEELQERLRKDSFTLEDFGIQLKQLKKMGPLDQVMKMVPGLARLVGSRDFSHDEEDLGRYEAIIGSMTRGERLDHTLIDGSRRRRIARGSGTSVQDVNQLLKQYAQMRRQMKGMKKLIGRKGLRGMF